jgi:hypothetical protein
MRITGKFVGGMGAGLAAAALLTMVVPRAAHAVVATLVQVANSAASPAVTQDVSRLASQNVSLVLPVGLTPGGNLLMYQAFPNGSVAEYPYVVPAGQNLMVTGIDLIPGGTTTGKIRLFIYNVVSNNVRQELAIQDSLNETQIHLPVGIVFPAGESVAFTNESISTGSVLVNVHGYLTAN